MSLGVCLPGGGAKGAFQAGVLEVLYDRGIKKYDSTASPHGIAPAAVK